MGKANDTINVHLLLKHLKEEENYLKEQLNEADRFLGEFIRNHIDNLITEGCEIKFKDVISYLDRLLNCEMNSAQLDYIKELQDSVLNLSIKN